MTEVRSYHGQPVLKQPTWTWEVPVYFFAGGMAGASAGLAYVSGLRGNDVLARRAWTAAAGAIVVSPPLLISDLGQPARFLNMLRMFKVTSPMSVGSWILSASGAATAVAAANQWTGVFPRAAKAAPSRSRRLRAAALHLHGGLDRQHGGAALARGTPLAAVRVRVRSGGQRRCGSGRTHPN